VAVSAETASAAVASAKVAGSALNIAEQSSEEAAVGGARRLLLRRQTVVETDSNRVGSPHQRRLKSSSSLRRSLRAVFPVDERQEVTGRATYPYSAVVRRQCCC
jgi:V8-like Glu-specific endopeptidase